MSQPEKASKTKQVDNRKPRNNIYFKLIIGLIVITLACAALYLVFKDGQKNDPTIEKARYEKMIKDTDKANSVNDLYKKKRILDDYLKVKTDNQDYLYEAEIRLIQTCAAIKNYTCANESGKRALKLGVEKKYYSLYELLGDVNVNLKNYDDAAKLYEEAINILKVSNDPVAGGQRSRVESKLNFVNNILKKS